MYNKQNNLNKIWVKFDGIQRWIPRFKCCDCWIEFQGKTSLKDKVITTWISKQNELLQTKETGTKRNWNENKRLMMQLSFEKGDDEIEFCTK